MQTSSLMMAALLWQDGLRTLRLVRYHVAKRLQQGTANVNLASLPQEIFWMIEDELASSIHDSLSYDVPFMFECTCWEDIVNEFMESDEFDDAFDDFAMTNGLDPYDPTTFHAFLGSDEFEAGLEDAEEMHFGVNCLADREEMEYWEQIASGRIKRKSANYSMVGISRTWCMHILGRALTVLQIRSKCIEKLSKFFWKNLVCTALHTIVG
jgi:hypothetical protein